MLTLDSKFLIPVWISSIKIENDAVLLNTRSKKYFALSEVGSSLWEELKKGTPVRQGVAALFALYDVPAEQLEADTLSLLEDLVKNGLLEVVEK